VARNSSEDIVTGEHRERHYGNVTSGLPPDRLVSDGEREPVVESLRQAFADGRLTQDEFGQRISVALTARTHAQLAPVMAGLPGLPGPAPVMAGLPGLPGPAPGPGAGEWPADRSAAVIAHLLGIVTSFVGPLVMVLVTRGDRTSFARSQAVEALNFQLSLLLMSIVTLGLGYVLWPVAWVFCIIAAVSAGNGRAYRYPLALRPVH
jgi:uncharacterized Tic20 family protein